VINNLYADPTKIMDEAKTSEEISKIITMEKSDIAGILKKRQVRYVKILTKLDLQLKDKVDERILNEKNAISK
jgi:hypothetical protein